MCIYPLPVSPLFLKCDVIFEFSINQNIISNYSFHLRLKQNYYFKNKCGEKNCFTVNQTDVDLVVLCKCDYKSTCSDLAYLFILICPVSVIVNDKLSGTIFMRWLYGRSETRKQTSREKDKWNKWNWRKKISRLKVKPCFEHQAKNLNKLSIVKQRILF